MSAPVSAEAPSPGGGGRHAWIDASAGVAGDMLLGALVDAGASLAQVQDAVDAVLPATVRLSSHEVTRAGLRATKVEVEVLVEQTSHRDWREIRGLLGAAVLPDPTRQHAMRTFEVLAEAEARVHGTTPEEVHFHEVGAWDSIADVVGVSAALRLLDIATVSAGPVALGSGRATMAHGDLPIPGPAVLELARGWDVVTGGVGELATPTGMALVRALSQGCEPLPPMRVLRTGLGAGTRDPSGRANVVRVVLGDVTARTGGAAQPMWVLEANVDDLDPRVWPEVLAALMADGAADAWLTPILMKKGRPAHTLSVLSSGPDRERLRRLVFGLTSTFGVREYVVDRVALDRAWRGVVVRGQSVRVKLSLDAAKRIVHATPEFGDAVAAASASGVPVRRMLEECADAAAAAGLRPGAPLSPE